MLNIKNILISSVVLLTLDSVYLNMVSGYFNKIIKNIQGTKIQLNYYGAIYCYIFLILGLNYFVLENNESPIKAGILGLVIYGVYEGTNYAILKNWTPTAVILDTLWGGVLFYLTAYITYKLKKYIKM
tara:strand:+ start:1733 stop:2116 length:384 start_codon:yes stop_codon:yes gene_type:complete